MSAPTPTGSGHPPAPPDEAAEAQIVLRVARSRKAAYVRAAVRTNRTLAAWAFEHLDNAAGYKPSPVPQHPKS
jgi:hypothetical protein